MPKEPKLPRGIQDWALGWSPWHLRAAIKTHREQKADDRCIEDDDDLYAALGDGIKCDRRVGSKEEMLYNCSRFIDRRCEGGHWPTYIQLETIAHEAIHLIKNSQTKTIGSFCYLLADRWQRILDGKEKSDGGIMFPRNG